MWIKKKKNYSTNGLIRTNKRGERERERERRRERGGFSKRCTKKVMEEEKIEEIEEIKEHIIFKYLPNLFI